jgi:integrase
MTVAEAVEKYEAFLKEKGNKPRSIDQTIWRVKRFFDVTDEDDGGALSTLSSKTVAAMYDTLAGVLAVDTHRNVLAETKSFLKWCVGRRWLRENPLDGVQGKGRRKHGKPQLRIDEARKWDATAMAMAETEPGAVAALAALYMGLRASELVERQVRDVDDGCSVLWIPETKTEAGRRRVRIPEQLRVHFQRMVEGKDPEAWLFIGRYHKKRNCHRYRKWVANWTARICVAAKVPKVCAHSLRGLHGTLAEEEGATGAVVARALGHESETTTHESYVTREGQAAAKQRRTLGILKGGK